MNEPRNPFIMRTSERIESDSTFLRLFGPGVLDLLPQKDLWGKLHIFLSSPGGGKTSLFRVFTPSTLLELYRSQTNEDYKELFQTMKSLGVFSEQGPDVLGIMLSCARNYATLEDLNLGSGIGERLFYSLLNARLILAMLRGAATLVKVNYPTELNNLTIDIPEEFEQMVQLPKACPGDILYDWACSIEMRICETIDSLIPEDAESLEGLSTLPALFMFNPNGITFNGTPVAKRILVMLDDVQKLAPVQRTKLFTTFTDLRLPIGIWISERLEALSSNELLAPGVTEGREYVEINLEKYWKDYSKKFENAAKNIADRRARWAQDSRIGSFSGCLQETLDDVEWRNKYEYAIEVISNRIQKRLTYTERYEKWVEWQETRDGTVRQRAIAWRMLEILIERDLRRIQGSLDFGISLEPEELLQRDSSKDRTAAEYLLSKEFQLPYYFGTSRLTTLASSNIEQFLAFSSELFEEILSAALLRKSTVLSPMRQEDILIKAVSDRWKEIPRRIPGGRDIQKFLNEISVYANWETTKPNAPYAPGVTGIALSEEDRKKLIELRNDSQCPNYERLATVITNCITYNLLEFEPDRAQGQKGKTWNIFYLNRWLCMYFGLPLHKGGWRPKGLDELCTWLDKGFKVPNKNGGNLLS